MMRSFMALLIEKYARQIVILTQVPVQDQARVGMVHDQLGERPDSS